jgi:cytochrome c oxidase subunit II
MRTNLLMVQAQPDHDLPAFSGVNETLRITRGTLHMKIKNLLVVSSLFAALAGFAVARTNFASNTAHDPQTITIRASRFAFEPNEITVKKGSPVKVIIQSEDVSHGLVIDDLGIRAEVKKGQSATIGFTPEATGTFDGKCAHFCGSGHGTMTLTIHVVDSGAQ